ncbi:unnamed protein product [Callosobruchus maculatus]|uniref:Uncharacterized protein n=1 Tax=Callosobruchus maculatus TaxID=64391 RepID=A0A653CCJ4_CALMS|nr:unnamed protein product [Callosobruchus maculatus]
MSLFQQLVHRYLFYPLRDLAFTGLLGHQIPQSPSSNHSFLPRMLSSPNIQDVLVRMNLTRYTHYILQL